MARALVNRLKKEKTYFPKIDISYNVDEIKFELTLATLVRILSTDNQWYICPIIKTFISDNKDYQVNNTLYINTLLEQAYVTLLLGTLTDNSDLLFELDELQMTEKERLTEITLCTRWKNADPYAIVKEDPEKEG